MEPGSSYLPSDLNAAYLWAQLEIADEIYADRMASWNLYNETLAPLQEAGYLSLPTIPEGCVHNAHMYYIKAKDLEERSALIRFLKENDISTVFHYIPLHSAPAERSTAASTERTDTRPARANDFCVFHSTTVLKEKKY